MDGLDTLSQVALDQINLTNLANLCFDCGSVPGGGRLPSESFDDSLNTPVTSNSDTFFGNDPLGPVPITATGMQCFFGLQLLLLTTYVLYYNFQSVSQAICYMHSQSLYYSVMLEKVQNPDRISALSISCWGMLLLLESLICIHVAMCVSKCRCQVHS